MYQVRYPITIWLTNKMASGKNKEKLTTFNRMKSEQMHIQKTQYQMNRYPCHSMVVAEYERMDGWMDGWLNVCLHCFTSGNHFAFVCDE